MKTKQPILIAAFLFFSVAAYPQNYTGVWKGFLNTTVNGVAKKLPFKIFIQGRGNDSYNGITELTMAVKDSDYRYECRLMGSLSDGKFRWRDGEVRTETDPPIPGFYWCIKSGMLQMQKKPDGSKTLTGDFTGWSDKGNCPGGTVTLTYFAKDGI